MIDLIKTHIEEPEKLERLYQDDKKLFKSNFLELYSEIENFPQAKFWKARLEYKKTVSKTFNIQKNDIIVLIATCFLTGLLIKLPAIFDFSIKDYSYYEKNSALIVFFGLSLYAVWKNQIFDSKKQFIIFLAFLFPAIYINYLPSDTDSHSINLAYIHLPLLMWCVYGLLYIDFDFKDNSKRIDYIKYNGDLAILSAIILIAGMILTGVTFGLFHAIDVDIQKVYMEYIVIWGMVSIPIVATFIIKNYPSLTNKIAPIIAKIFTPLVLITLLIYLITIPISGKDPYEDRDFLLVFNLMLLGVMGIIVFSITESSVNRRQKFNEMILFVLTVVTIIIDMIALSAIFYRLGEYGITPNRMAVLGSNLLVFGNLIFIMINLYKVNFKKSEIGIVEQTIAKYLPIYTAWTIIVVFAFPIIFGMK